jgi:hypothetical protein
VVSLLLGLLNGELWYGETWFHKLAIGVWPLFGALAVLPGDDLFPLATIAIFVALNMALYAVLGTVLWYGLNKHPVVLVPLAAAVLWFWWHLLILR